MEVVVTVNSKYDFSEVKKDISCEEAVSLSNHCLNCKNPMCKKGCPLEIDIPDFISAIKNEEYERAYEIISQKSVMPEVCGRVCPQELTCEAKCVRGLKGESVKIGNLERFVSNYKTPIKVKKSNGLKVAVVGSGPFGLSSAYHLKKEGFDVTVFESSHVLGGVLIYGIPEFRLPKKIVDDVIYKLENMGVIFKTDVLIGETITIEELKTNLRVISQAINSRQVNQNPLFNSSEEEKKLLPIDTLRDSYQRESVKEKKYIMLYSFLQKNGLISKNQYNFLKIRNAYISDVIGTLPSSLTYTNSSHFCGSDIDISSLADCNFYSDGSYYTPFGVKRIIAQQETENITNSTELNSVFMKLQTRMNQYTINYLINLLNNSETLLEEYKKIQSIEVEKDFNISLVEADLFTKLKSLTMSKELLISSGISQEIIQQKLESIEQYFNDITKKNTFTESEQREQDLDFLLGVLGDTKEVRQICEQHDGHRFTEEEWNTKSVNVQYMMQVFDKLKQMNIKPENIQIALNELFSNKDISAEKNRK